MSIKRIYMFKQMLIIVEHILVPDGKSDNQRTDNDIIRER